MFKCTLTPIYRNQDLRHECINVKFYTRRAIKMLRNRFLRLNSRALEQRSLNKNVDCEDEVEKKRKEETNE